jgi:hypothetical protein
LTVWKDAQKIRWSDDTSKERRMVVRKWMFALAYAGLVVVLVFGCGKRESEQPQTQSGAHPDELADSTRLDAGTAGTTGSLMVVESTLVDSASHMGEGDVGDRQ